MVILQKKVNLVMLKKERHVKIKIHEKKEERTEIKRVVKKKTSDLAIIDNKINYVVNIYRMTEHVKAVGSRAEVMHGNAKHTSGGLEKKHLMMNKRGRIVSRKKSKTAKKQKRLEKAGFKAKKGTFKLFKKSDGKTRRKRKGGFIHGAMHMGKGNYQ